MRWPGRSQIHPGGRWPERILPRLRRPDCPLRPRAASARRSSTRRRTSSNISAWVPDRWRSRSSSISSTHAQIVRATASRTWSSSERSGAARRSSSALSTAQLDLLGRDGIAIFAHAAVPSAPNPAPRRDGWARRPLARSPVERKIARQCAAETGAEQALQPPPRAQMPRLDGGRRNAEPLGDLADVELLDLAKHEDRAERRRELVDRVSRQSA